MFPLFGAFRMYQDMSSGKWQIESPLPSQQNGAAFFTAWWELNHSLPTLGAFCMIVLTSGLSFPCGNVLILNKYPSVYDSTGSTAIGALEASIKF